MTVPSWSHDLPRGPRGGNPLKKAPRSRVVLCGYYGFGNAGDELILGSMLLELRGLRPGLAVTVISGDPASTRASHGVDAVHWQDVPGIAGEVRHADLVIVGGGGLFQEYSGIDPDSLFTDRHYAITFYAEPAILGALCGRPVMLYAVGVGPLTSEHGRRTVRAACDAAEVITLRDEESARIVASLGVDPARLRVTADPAFALPVANGETAPDGLVPARPSRPELEVVVALRHWDVGVASHFWEQELAAGLDAFLSMHDARLLFVPFQRLARAPENDTAVAERVRSLLRHPDRATVHSGDSDQNALGGVLGGCDLVVGMRLHAVILAAVAGVPSVALSYDPKVDLAMRQVGAEEFVVPLPDIEARTVARRMEQALASAGARRKELGERVARLAGLARSNAAAAIDLLDRGSATRTLSPVLSEVIARTVASRFEVEAALRGEAAVLRDAKGHAETAIAELGSARAAAEAAVEARSVELRQTSEELSTCRAELAQAKSVMGRLDAEQLQIRGDLEARDAELQEARGDLEARGAELRQVRGDVEVRDTELRQVRGDLEARDAELQQVRGDLGEESAELERTLDDLARQDESLERLQAEATQLHDRVVRLEGELVRIHRSRLWKLATRYWRFLDLIGRLPGPKG